MNVIVFIVFLCESHLKQKNPQPAPLSRVSGSFPACFTLPMKTTNYGPRLAQRRGFRAGPNADSLGWIWIVSQMSSWINMAIYFKLQLESNCTLSCLRFLFSSSSCEADSSLCFKPGLSSSAIIAVKQWEQIQYRVHVFSSTPHFNIKNIRCCQITEH